MHITRLELQIADLKEQALFYGETLGLDTRIIAGTQVIVRAGATELVFTQADENQRGFYHFAFNIPENQFETAKRWLAMRAELLADEDGNTSIDFGNWNSHSLYFKDAAGNILELIARHDLQNASEGFEILSVSEIGLATEDVLALVRSLQENTGLLPYKDESSETFTAVGNADGLFIVVKQGRIWYPNTGVPAQLLPVRAYIQVDETKMVLSGVPYQMELQMSP
jgi:Predicted ring-cleavage extradiol dioxygenase